VWWADSPDVEGFYAADDGLAPLIQRATELSTCSSTPSVDLLASRMPTTAIPALSSSPGRR
jgi:hypothetical protein